MSDSLNTKEFKSKIQKKIVVVDKINQIEEKLTLLNNIENDYKDENDSSLNINSQLEVENFDLKIGLMNALLEENQILIFDKLRSGISFLMSEFTIFPSDLAFYLPYSVKEIEEALKIGKYSTEQELIILDICKFLLNINRTAN